MLLTKKVQWNQYFLLSAPRQNLRGLDFSAGLKMSTERSTMNFDHKKKSDFKSGTEEYTRQNSRNIRNIQLCFLLLSLYGPWPYGPMALVLWLWSDGPMAHILVSRNFGKLTRYHIFRSFSDIKL